MSLTSITIPAQPAYDWIAASPPQPCIDESKINCLSRINKFTGPPGMGLESAPVVVWLEKDVRAAEEEATTITVANMHLYTRKIPTAERRVACYSQITLARLAHQIHLHRFSGFFSNLDRDLGELGSTCSGIQRTCEDVRTGEHQS